LNALFLHKDPENVAGEIEISGSKSESNRLRVLNQLFNQQIDIQNLSDSSDTKYLQNAFNNQKKEIYIHNAGTAMRFLTGYFAIQEGKETMLTGSARMKERPIGILVEALRSIGAEIDYVENKGFPPLLIHGKKLTGNKISLPANVSSQFITALILIAPKLENGLEIELKDKITSLPYLKMTIELMKRIGVRAEFSGQIIRVYPQGRIRRQTIVVESDWSSASYFYSLAAIAHNANIQLKHFNQKTIQGDAEIVRIYREHFGVETEFREGRILLMKNENFIPRNFELDMNDTPDIAQTVAVSCAALRIYCKLTGLETLKLKEADRLSALGNELVKIGALSEVTNDSLELTEFRTPEKNALIYTYDDHRMAMSFAPFSLVEAIEIENPEVVEKSYLNFWEDFHSVTRDF